MKKNVILLSLIFIGFTLISHASVWRLNNDPGVDADFKGTLQEAIDAISSGDTIYVEQSHLSYGGAIISKKVILIGGGYWLEENDSTSAYKENSIAESLTFNPGSEGSTVMSMFLHQRYGYNHSFSLITVNADNITIRRNYIYGECYSWGGGEKIQIKTTGQRSGILVEQNWINAIASQHAFFIEGTAADIVIRNNFIHCMESTDSSMYAIEQVSGSVDFVVKNNVIWGSIKTYNAFFINNILLYGTYLNGSGLTANNMGDTTQFTTSNNNQQNVDMSTVFVDHDKYIDNGYILAEGSPAIIAGFNGGDCGAFSNDFEGNPYVLSGLPNIPAIFELTAEPLIFPSSTEMLEINLKAKSHN